MTLLGLLARWAHLASGVTLVGTFALLLLAGRSRAASAQRWNRDMLALARGAVVVALVSGVIALAVQAAVLEGRPGAALDPAALVRLLTTTQLGAVWLARHGILALLAAMLFLAGEPRSNADWTALRAEGLLLGLLSLTSAVGAGHAAAVEPSALLAVSMDALHVAAAAVWIGGLVPLARLLRIAESPPGADARPYAVLATGRFSGAALAAVLALVVTGAASAWIQVGGVAPLLGTPYGRLLLLKLGVVIALVGLGAINRRRFLPALGGDALTVGRPAMRGLRRSLAVEAAAALLLLGIVALMAATPPARHVDPTWPLPFRWSFAAAGDTPGASARVLVGSQIALLGALAAIVVAVQYRRRIALVGGLALGIVGVVVALPPITLEAHPTTYRAAAIPYRAASIAAGADAFRGTCVPCHQPSATDVSTPRVARATAGDLFWWITHGLPPRMPASPGLSEEQRWDVVNFLRAAESGRRGGPLAGVRPAPPSLVAPDFEYAVGPTPPHALREFRGRRAVVLAFFSLPESLPRLAQLATGYESLASAGAEVIAVPLDGRRDVLRRLADALPGSRIFYPVVTEGAAEIVRTYGLFAPGGSLTGHVEFLVDRTGYLRSRRAIAPGTPPDLTTLVGTVLELAIEPTPALALPEHVH